MEIVSALAFMAVAAPIPAGGFRYVPPAGTIPLRFVDYETGKVRLGFAPGHALLRSGKLEREGTRFLGEFGDPPRQKTRGWLHREQDPIVMELHLLGKSGTAAVCVLVLQGEADLPLVGRMQAYSSVYYFRSGKIDTTRAGFTLYRGKLDLSMPLVNGVIDWCAVTLFRPVDLPENFSPRLWRSVVSVQSGSVNRPTLAIPSLENFLDHEFGRK